MLTEGWDAKKKKATIETYWIPGVTNLGAFGRWAFAEFTDVWEIQSGFEAEVESQFNTMIERAAGVAAAGMG